MKINTKTKQVNLSSREDAIVNVEGGLSFKLGNKERFLNRLLTCLWNESKFYGNQDKELLEDLKEVIKEDKIFALKAAIYARNNMNLRTVPQVILVECANSKEYKGEHLIQQATAKIVKRADEIRECLAYQLKTYKKPIPNSLRRGLGKAMNNFDRYSLGKYNRKEEVTFKDAIRLLHPKPKDREQAIIFKEILDGTLASPETWEVILSNWKLKGFASKKEAWEHIITKIWMADGKVKNYMALLRNARNILEANVNDSAFNLVIEGITNENAIKYSKLFPFRYYSAYREIQGNTTPNVTKLMNAIEIAMTKSTANLSKLNGYTFMSADNSGSMDSKLSDRGTIKLKEIANIMQAIAVDICSNYTCSVFGDDFMVVNVTKTSSIIDRANKFIGTNVGYSTNGYKAIQYMLDNKIKADRLIVFTDMQMWNSNPYGEQEFAPIFNVYRQLVNPNMYLYLINLQGYGNVVVPQNIKNVALINGWSERILDFIAMFEADKTKMVDEIMAIQI